MKPEVSPEGEGLDHSSDFARYMVRDMLGDDFDVDKDFDEIRNVGTKGDGRAYGETTWLTTTSPTPAKAFGLPEHYGEPADKLQELVSTITTSSNSTRVAIEVTPPNAMPTFISAGRGAEVGSFRERALRRLAGYPVLNSKYRDVIDPPPPRFFVRALINLQRLSDRILPFYSPAKFIDEKYKADPMMATAVWKIMDLIDLKFKAKIERDIFKDKLKKSN